MTDPTAREGGGGGMLPLFMLVYWKQLFRPSLTQVVEQAKENGPKAGICCVYLLTDSLL